MCNYGGLNPPCIPLLQRGTNGMNKDNKNGTILYLCKLIALE